MARPGFLTFTPSLSEGVQGMLYAKKDQLYAPASEPVPEALGAQVVTWSVCPPSMYELTVENARIVIAGVYSGFLCAGPVY